MRVRTFAHETLFRRIGLGMLARGMDVDEIMRQAGPVEQASGRVAVNPGGRAAVALREVRCRAWPRRGAALSGGDERRAGSQQPIKQSRHRASARVGDVTASRIARQAQRVDGQS